MSNLNFSNSIPSESPDKPLIYEGFKNESAAEFSIFIFQIFKRDNLIYFILIIFTKAADIE